MGKIFDDFNNLKLKKTLRMTGSNGVSDVREFFREGGMAQIFRGTFNGQPVVIKTAKHSSDAPVMQDRMDFEIENKYIQKEAEALKKLQHPKLVRLLDFGIYNGENYLTEELLDGEVLTDKCLDNPFPEGEARRIILQIAEVIKYMHQNSFIHRDLSPNNIMMTSDSEIKLFDLGSATDDFNYNNQDLVQQQARRGTRIGTDFFSAHEQCNEGLATPQGDVYSLGAVFNYLLTGIWPSDYGPFSPHIDREGVSATLGEIVYRATQREIDKRYQTVDDFMAAVVKGSGDHLNGAFIIISGVSYPITKIHTIIGREDSNSQAHINVKDPNRHIALCSPSINKTAKGHCEIYWDHKNKKYYLKDLGSVNRTSVLVDRAQNVWKRLGMDLPSEIVMNDGDLFTFAYDSKKGYYITFTFKNYGSV